MEFCLLLYLFSTFVCGQGAAAEYQRFRETPQSVEVAEGDNVFLRCAVENQQGKAQWTKDGFALGFERHVPGYPRYTYDGDPSIGEHHLVITSVTLTEDGEYQCQVGPTNSSPPIWAAANVTVLLPPTSITIVGWGDGAEVQVAEGTSLTLECLVTGARPPPKVEWFHGGSQVDPALQQDHVEPLAQSGTWNLRSQLQVTARPEDDGKAIGCRAVHPALGKATSGELVASITLSVLHPPSAPTITGYVTGDVLRSGERRTLSCRVDGGNPRAWVLWYRRGTLVDDASVTDGNGVTNIHELAVTAEEDGAVYECSVTNDVMDHSLVANVTLTVYYPPSSVAITGISEVEAGSSFSLTCETSDSNPPASLTWIVSGEVVENTKSVVGKDSTGGWVTSSELLDYQVSSPNATEVTVECRAVNPAIDEVVKKTKVITITRPPGPPIFENDLQKEVVSGTTLDLTCLSFGGHPPPDISIFKEGELVATESTHDGNVTRARAEVEVTPVDNDAKVSCEVKNPATKAPIEVTARLSVLFAPWDISEAVKPSTVEEGHDVTLICETSSALPPANVTWRSGEVTVDGGVSERLPGAFGGTKTRSELRLRAAAEDNGRVFSCVADNGIRPTVKKDITVHVLHAPFWIIKPPSRMHVYEGAELVITATASANPGPPSYWWRRGEDTLKAPKGELHLGQVKRHHSGNYSVNAYNARGAINATFTLDVQYGPETVQAAERVTVGEGGAATVECSASANPTPTITWTKDAHIQNSTTQTLSTGVGVARLVLDKAMWADTGVYLCHASNIVSSAPPVKTKIIVTQGVTIASEVAGSSGSWAAIGTNGRLICRVRAAPAPTFAWSTQDGHTLQNSEKFNIHEPQLVDGLVLWASVLEIRHVTRDDYTVYLCTAHNVLGSGTATLTLNPPARPHAPTNFSVINVTSVAVSLAWTPNFDGGMPRGYTVRYRPSSTSEYQMVEISGSNTAGTTLGGLQPATEYYFSVQAKNDQGRSKFVTPALTATTLGIANDPSTMVSGASRVPRLILLIMTLTGAALLVLNIAIIACFVRRRSVARNSSASSSTKTVAMDAFGNTPASTPGATHGEVLLSLTTMSVQNMSQGNQGYKEEQTDVDEGERKGRVSGGASEGRGGVVPPLTNGSVATSSSRKNSTSSSSRNGGILVRKNSNAQNGGIPQNNGVGGNGVGGNGDAPPTPVNSSPLPQNGRIPGGKTNPPATPTPTINPEVCSLSSSTYDTQPPLQQHPQQQRRNSGSSSYPAEDQISLASYHSNHSRTYSQGYVRPLPPPGCPHHPPRPQPQYQVQPYQQGPGDQPQQAIQSPSAYSSLNPSSLYSLSTEYYDARCSQSTFSPGPPLGYATLGPRSRRTSPSQFATLQRPRPSRSLSQSAAHSQPLHPHVAPAGCQGQCCQGPRHLQDEECDRHGLCRSTSEDGQELQPRRSSFHGPMRRESNHHYDVSALLPHGRPVPTPSIGQQHVRAAHHQENGYGSKQLQQEVPRTPIATSQSSRCPSRSASCSSHTNLSADLSIEEVQSPSSRGSPAHRDASGQGAVDTREPLTAGIGRPRFPHDYVRQGSSKKSSASSRNGRDGNGGGVDKKQR